MRNSRLFSIFLVVFIDLLGFGLILPLLPFYAENYAASALLIGLLTASYSAAQLIAAPILGRLSDQYGRRPVLLASIGGIVRVPVTRVRRSSWQGDSFLILRWFTLYHVPKLCNSWYLVRQPDY